MYGEHVSYKRVRQRVIRASGPSSGSPPVPTVYLASLRQLMARRRIDDNGKMDFDNDTLGIVLRVQLSLIIYKHAIAPGFLVGHLVGWWYSCLS